MGRVKQAMIEAESYVYEETPVNFVCPKCRKVSDGSVEIPKIDQEFPDDIDTDVDVNCIWCDEAFTAIVHLGDSDCSMKLDGYPKTKVDFEPVYFSSPHVDDYWLEEEYFYELSKEPFPVFESSHIDVMSFVDAYGNEDGINPMNRMIFAQSFSVFEAYLCDTYLNFVFLDENNQNLFLQKHKEMKKLSISASELLAHKDLTANEIIQKKITQIIKETLFHNLNKTNALFHMYGINIFPNENVKEELFKAVEYRHHCVHRNGCDKEGNKLDVYTKTYIQKIAAAMLSSAMFIEKNINDKMLDNLDF